MNKLDQAVAYLVKVCAEKGIVPLTRTKLVKYLYLADLCAAEKGQPITSVSYRSYYFGPYSPEILEAATRQPKHVKQSCLMRSDGAPYYVYEPGPVPARTPSLTAKERATIDKILDDYGRYSLRQLLKQVYDTKPFKTARMMEEIRLH